MGVMVQLSMSGGFSVDKLKSLLNDFDLTNLLPNLSDTLGRVGTLLRTVVLLGPLVLLGLGLIYFLAPPKEANYSFGFRTFWGMSSVEAWRFTQKVGGITWAALGLVLTVVMAIICSGFQKMELMDMAMLALKCVVWEIALAAVSWLAVSGVVIAFFDRDGCRRKKKS